jgi:hypothetical protein
MSVRDIEAVFPGRRAYRRLTRAAVSDLRERLSRDFQTFVSRDLSGHEVL